MGVGVNTNVNIRVVAPKNGETVLSRAKLFFIGEYKIVRRVELSDQSRMGGNELPGYYRSVPTGQIRQTPGRQAQAEISRAPRAY